jgi:hypothetical protein
MSLPGLLLAVTMFKLTPAHLQLLRHCVVLWSSVESGAPGALPSSLLVEDNEKISDATYADIAKHAGLAKVDKAEINHLLMEMPEAFEQLIAHGTLAPGTYRYDNPLAAIPWAAQALPTELANLATDKVVTFQFTERHAKLLRAAQWEGMMMNPKRPYGDMTSFELDMADILGEPHDEKKMWKLHTEMLSALQVFLQNAKLEP